MKFDFGIDMQVKAKQAMQAISTNLQALGFTLNTCSGCQASGRVGVVVGPLEHHQAHASPGVRLRRGLVGSAAA